jgi:hypothetical protein
MLMFEISKYVCINSVFATVGASQQKLSKPVRLVIVPYSQKHEITLSLSLDFLSLSKNLSGFGWDPLDWLIIYNFSHELNLVAKSLEALL